MTGIFFCKRNSHLANHIAFLCISYFAFWPGWYAPVAWHAAFPPRQANCDWVDDILNLMLHDNVTQELRGAANTLFVNFVAVIRECKMKRKKKLLRFPLRYVVPLRDMQE